MSKAVTPGIPAAALSSIEDPNARAILEALITGWEMRNGYTGTGDNKFLTKADVRDVAVDLFGGKSFNQAVTDIISATPPGGKPSVAQLLNELQGQITESALWKSLAERIDLIDKPGGIFTRLGNTEASIFNETTARTEQDTALLNQINAMGVRVGTSEAAIASETTARVNADNAILTQVNTQYTQTQASFAAQQATNTTLTNNYSALSQSTGVLQATVGTLTTSLEQESITRANADGNLFAQYTVKVDQDGYVAGFGFASTSNDAWSFSEFYIRADRFAIGAPGVGKAIPFIVQTTAWTDSNGNVQSPGVYMDAAFIKKATIDTAHIRFAAIDTLQIAGSAITVPLTATGSLSSVGTGYSTVCAVSYNTASNPAQVPTAFIISAAVNVINSGGPAVTVEAEITRNGTPIVHYGISLAGGYSGTIPIVAMDTAIAPNAGYTWAVTIKQSGGATLDVPSGTMFVLGSKR